MASFFARRTMFSIMAPDAKSLKYMISLSPFWYVTSRNWFALVGAVHLGGGGLDHPLHGLGRVAPAEALHGLLVEGQVRREVAGEDLRGRALRSGARS